MKLNLNIFDDNQNSMPRRALWISIADYQNSAFAQSNAINKLEYVISHDRAVKEALNVLRRTKSAIVQHGASESLMTIVNTNNELGSVIGVDIPEINNYNYRAIGSSCCEGIDVVINDSYNKAKVFFSSICSAANNFVSTLDAATKDQSKTVSAINRYVINDLQALNGRSFSTEGVFGYTEPVYINRLDALQYIADNLSSPMTSIEDIQSFVQPLKTLGYCIIKKSEEDLDPTAPAVTEPVVVPETPEETKVDEPSPSTVMNPEAPAIAPAANPSFVHDPSVEPTPTIVPEETPATTPDPVIETPASISTEEPAPTDAPQLQTMATFKWTPASIKNAGAKLENLLNSTYKLNAIRISLAQLSNNAIRTINSLENLTGEEKLNAEASVDTARNAASFIGDVLGLYGKATKELVDQYVCMTGKMAEYSVPMSNESAVFIDSITVNNPFGRCCNHDPSTVVEEPIAEPVVQEPIAEPVVTPGVIEEPVAPVTPTEPVAPTEPAPQPTPETPVEPEPEAAPTSSFWKYWDEMEDDVEDGCCGGKGKKGKKKTKVIPSDAKILNEIEEPENVPNAEPIDAPKGVCPNGCPEVHKGETFIEPVETPEEDQPKEHAETLLEDLMHTRLW